mmetsp:Transcript_74207/g.198015  ORF Transcript_74207/g.198015 Transcript_74207/m.198015 type:complete len:108 (-) Transcript_74207:271-594(-)
MQNRLLDQVHWEIKVLVAVYVILIFFVLYALLYRTAIFAANKEIDKTKQFVLMLPVGVLTRQDLECVKAYFVASDMDHHFEMEDDELAKCAEDSDVDQRKDIVRRGQ